MDGYRDGWMDGYRDGWVDIAKVVNVDGMRMCVNDTAT